MSSLLCPRAFISMSWIFLQVRTYTDIICKLIFKNRQIQNEIYNIQKRYGLLNNFYINRVGNEFQFYTFFRRHNDQSDALNCDLTDTNTTSLDQYNPRHFVQNTITDVYQLYYKNDGSLYCDNLRDAENKKLIMFIKPNANNNEKYSLSQPMTIDEKNINVTSENSVQVQKHESGIEISNNFGIDFYLRYNLSLKLLYKNLSNIGLHFLV